MGQITMSQAAATAKEFIKKQTIEENINDTSTSSVVSPAILPDSE